MSAGKQLLGTEGVVWDLFVFYGGIDDPNLRRDVEELRRSARSFSDAYRGRVGERLGEALREYAEITTLSGKIFRFLSLLLAENQNNDGARSKFSEVKEISDSLQGEYFVFFPLELARLGDEVLELHFAKDAFAKKHRAWIEEVRISGKYLLSHEVEGALAKRGQFGSSSSPAYLD